jgi:hypothetical protein
MTGRALKINELDNVVVIDIDFHEELDEEGKEEAREVIRDQLSTIPEVGPITLTTSGGLHI